MRGLAIDHMGKAGQKLRAVKIITDDVLAGIPPTCDAIDGPGDFKTKRTCHGAGVHPSQCAIASPDPDTATVC